MYACLLLAQSRRSSACGFTSAFGGKADIERDPSEWLLLTRSGHSPRGIVAMLLNEFVGGAVNVDGGGYGHYPSRGYTNESLSALGFNTKESSAVSWYVAPNPANISFDSSSGSPQH